MQQMKNYLLILALGCAAFTSDHAAPIERLGVAGPLTFHKTVFRLAWSAKPSASYYAQEYLPQGEQATTYQQMLALHLSGQDAEVQATVNRKITELEARKQADPTCHYQVMSNPATKEVLLDFLLSQDLSGPASIVEFNVYRYRLADLGPQQPGVLLYAYTKRAYGKDIDPFLKNLKTFRAQAIAEMAAAKVPAVKVKFAN